MGHIKTYLDDQFADKWDGLLSTNQSDVWHRIDAAKKRIISTRHRNEEKKKDEEGSESKRKCFTNDEQLASYCIE